MMVLFLFKICEGWGWRIVLLFVWCRVMIIKVFLLWIFIFIMVWFMVGEFGVIISLFICIFMLVNRLFKKFCLLGWLRKFCWFDWVIKFVIWIVFIVRGKIIWFVFVSLSFFFVLGIFFWVKMVKWELSFFVVRVIKILVVFFGKIVVKVFVFIIFNICNCFFLVVFL